MYVIADIKEVLYAGFDFYVNEFLEYKRDYSVLRP